ncbi:MAG TPA: SBBP repeat-containing protein [Actinomycetales bacterium]|nr:SBBP repeat-containing protein [Actinomycetales bacterium]
MSVQSARARPDRRPFTVAVVTTAGLLLIGGVVGLSSRGLPGKDAAPANATRAVERQPAAAPAGAAAAARNNGRSVDFSTYYGGRLWDEATDTEVDAAGNTYVAGFTLSSRFVVGPPARRPFGGLVDGFVAKFAPDGQRVLWTTFLGGVDIDIINSIALDKSGNAYVTGMTGSENFPTTGGVMQPAIRAEDCQGEPCHDAFVTKFSPNGQIVYSTFLGGRFNDEGVGIAVDSNNRAYVSGNTDSIDFPTANPFQAKPRGIPCSGDLPCPYDVFVAKVGQNGRGLFYGTYLGGKERDTAGGIAVGSDGSAYVTGTTRSADFPTSAARSPAIHGRACGPPPNVPCADAFVTKLTPAGNRLSYSTYLGGVKPETGSGIAVGTDGTAVVTGSTQSRDFPTRQALQGRLDNASCTELQPQEQCDDGFVTKFTPSGRDFVYSTYFGGKAEDQGLAVAVGSNGTAYVGGRTDSRNFRVRDAVQPNFGGYIDGFASAITSTGQLNWSTFVGGKEADRVEGISVNPSGRVRVAGRTLSPNFPIRRPVQSALVDKDYDAFVMGLR